MDRQPCFFFSMKVTLSPPPEGSQESGPAQDFVLLLVGGQILGFCA